MRLVVRAALLAVATAACGASVEARLDEARRLHAEGRFEESLPALRDLVADRPRDPDANLLLGTALLGSGRLSQAVWPLARAAESGPHAVDAGLLLGQAHLATQNFEEALRAADRVLEHAPAARAALELRTRAQLGAREFERAIADADRLLESEPDDPTARLLRAAVLVELERFDEAAVAYTGLKQLARKLARESIDNEQAIQGWVELARLHHRRGELQPAEAEYAELLEVQPVHPLPLRFAGEFFDATGRPERALALWRGALERAPWNPAFRLELAQRLAARGEVDEAESLLEEGTRLYESAEAWQALAELRRTRGDATGAVAALERAAELAPEAAPLRFALADAWIDAGELDRAVATAADLDEVYRKLIGGRVQLARGDPEAALESFEAAIRIWPNHAAARFLSGQAALALGRLERAVVELREAWRNGPDATDAALVLAKLQWARGQRAEAVEFAQRYLQAPRTRAGPGAAEAMILLARAHAAAGRPKLARELLAQLSRSPGQAARAAAERATLERKLAGARAAVRAIDSSQLDLADPANHLALASVVQDLAELRETRAALAHLDVAFTVQGDTAALLDLRGRVLAVAGRAEEAGAAFELALAQDADYAPALAGLATLAAERGEREQAVALFDRAAASGDGSAALQAAKLALELGRREDAGKRLDQIVRRDPGQAEARNNLAWLLAESGSELDRALVLAEEAQAIEPDANHLDTLGFVHLQRGDAAGAVAAFEGALALEPQAASTRYRLGLAHAQRGEREAARAALAAALEDSDFPEAPAARAALAKLDGSGG